MLPTSFGKSINFHLLPRVAKALQCCDTTSLQTAYNISSPGVIYSSNFIAHTQLLCPLHATVVSIRRRSLITLTNEKKYNNMLFFLMQILGRVFEFTSKGQLNFCLHRLRKNERKKKNHFERAQKFAENKRVFPLHVAHKMF